MPSGRGLRVPRDHRCKLGPVGAVVLAHRIGDVGADGTEADAEDAGGHAGLLGRVGGLSEIELDGRTLRARAEDGGAAIPAVLAALEAHGVKATSVTLARPSLDDVYLRHAGRAFNQADSEHEEVAA